MSTRNTLVAGKSFHLWVDCFSDEAVWLTLAKASFEATRDSVTVAIPLPVWEHIRTFSPVKLDLTRKTDGELRMIAAERVDQWRHEYWKLRKANPTPKKGTNAYDALRLHRPQTSRARDIDELTVDLKTERATQKRLLRQLRALRGAGQCDPLGNAPRRTGGPR